MFIHFKSMDLRRKDIVSGNLAKETETSETRRNDPNLFVS